MTEQQVMDAEDAILFRTKLVTLRQQVQEARDREASAKGAYGEAAKRRREAEAALESYLSDYARPLPLFENSGRANDPPPPRHPKLETMRRRRPSCPAPARSATRRPGRSAATTRSRPSRPASSGWPRPPRRACRQTGRARPHRRHPHPSPSSSRSSPMLSTTRSPAPTGLVPGASTDTATATAATPTCSAESPAPRGTAPPASAGAGSQRAMAAGSRRQSARRKGQRHEHPHNLEDEK